MHIIFRIYALLWIFILFLYNLKWSKYSIPLDFNLIVFLIVVITSSLMLGMKKGNSRIKKYDIVDENKIKNAKKHVVLIWIGFILNFIYAGYVPIIGILSGRNEYVEFPGIPTLYPFLFTLTLVYFYYLCYLYFLKKDRNLIIYAMSLLFVFFCVYSRSLMAFAAIGAFLIKMLVQSKGKKKNKKMMNYVILFLMVAIVCFLFGCLGNMRYGYAWNDNSYIQTLGLYDNYPSWLPKQYMWIYSYLISPLANLNYNIVYHNTHNDIGRFFVTFIPEFISKRYFSDAVISSAKETLLIRTYFNAQTGFVEPYYSFGIVGCYISYFVMVAYISILNILNRKNHDPVVIVGCFVFLTLSFFYNVFFYTLTSMTMIWLLLYLLKKVRIKIKL